VAVSIQSNIAIQEVHYDYLCENSVYDLQASSEAPPVAIAKVYIYFIDAHRVVMVMG